MTGMEQLYSGPILEHYRRPRNRGRLERATASATLHSPLCGDVMTIDVRLEAGGGAPARIAACSFEGEGCAVCQASASILTDAVIGQPVGAARAVAQRLVRSARAAPAAPAGNESPPDGPPRAVDGLAALHLLKDALQGSARTRCVGLAWEALLAALDEAAPEPR